MGDSLAYELLASLKEHLDSVWTGDLYVGQNQVQTASCPGTLTSLFTYKDRQNVSRILGPSKVVVGREQEELIDASGNALVPSLLVEVYHHDPEEVEKWRDSIYGSFDSAQTLDQLPLLEVGSGGRYHRRFVLKSTLYAMDADLDADEVTRLGCNIEAFLESVLAGNFAWTWTMRDSENKDIQDPFGEAPWRCYPVISHSRRRGGPPDDFIWDVKVYFEVATWR
jgi:hypothetical protein